MARIFIENFFDQAAPAFNSPNVKNAVEREANEILSERKRELLDEFNDHPITQDLEAGPDGDGNNSGALSSRSGNLYSFIGFERGYEPADFIRKFIINEITLGKNGKFDRRNKGFTWDVNIFSMEDIYSQTPFHGWDGGISWLKGIETHISGLSYYMSVFENGLAFKVQDIIKKASRSGTAIQSEKFAKQKRIPFIQFRPKKYMRDMMKKFRAQFRGPGGQFI